METPPSPPVFPTIALHFVAKNPAAYLPRLLGTLGNQIEEVVCALVDTTDESEALLGNWSENLGKRVHVVHVNRETYPDLYFLDAPETYDSKGSSLMGESIVAGCTGEHIIADWSAVRTLAWDQCKADWRLHMDIDDVMMNHEFLRQLCSTLDKQGCDLAILRTVRKMDVHGRIVDQGFSGRLAKNLPEIGWRHAVGEALGGYRQAVMFDGDLRVVRVRDLGEPEARSIDREFRTLYWYARSRNWDVPMRTLLQFAELASGLPAFARYTADLFVERSRDNERRARALACKGESLEGEGNLAAAAECYELALATHPGTLTAFRLCRVRYHQGRFVAAIAAYNQGVANAQISQVVEDGPYQKMLCEILVADCYWRIGRRDDALEFVDLALTTFPDSAALAKMKESIVAGESPAPWQPKEAVK